MKIKHNVIILLVIALCVTGLAEAKKKKKKKTKDPLNKRPSSVSAELFCDACLAVLKETMKELRGKKKESDVIDAMTDVCNPEKYNIYHFPPPDMREGCVAFVSAWDEEIQKVLINRKDDETPVQQLCYDITKACENVDWNNIKSFDDTIMIDGQPVKMADLQMQAPDEKQQENANDL